LDGGIYFAKLLTVHDILPNDLFEGSNHDYPDASVDYQPFQMLQTEGLQSLVYHAI
jgi:hypothetical protein